MGLRVDLAASLLVMVLMTYICEAALLRKSSAADFLRSGREKRVAAKCFPAGCSMEDSEAEELLEANSDYDESSNMLSNDGSQVEMNLSLDSEAMDEGSGM